MLINGSARYRGLYWIAGRHGTTRTRSPTAANHASIRQIQPFLTRTLSHPSLITMVNAPNGSSSALIKNTGDVRNRAGIANYTKHWETDLSKDTNEDSETRKGVYAEVVNGYYDGMLMHYSRARRRQTRLNHPTRRRRLLQPLLFAADTLQRSLDTQELQNCMSMAGAKASISVPSSFPFFPFPSLPRRARSGALPL